MQSINELKQWKQFFSMKENTTPATRRNRPRATRKAAIETWAASGVFILLFVASVAYVAFGGTLATEPSPPPEAAAAAAAVTAGLGDAGGALRNESVSITVEEGTQ